MLYRLTWTGQISRTKHNLAHSRSIRQSVLLYKKHQEKTNLSWEWSSDLCSTLETVWVTAQTVEQMECRGVSRSVAECLEIQSLPTRVFHSWAWNRMMSSDNILKPRSYSTKPGLGVAWCPRTLTNLRKSWQVHHTFQWKSMVLWVPSLKTPMSENGLTTPKAVISTVYLGYHFDFKLKRIAKLLPILHRSSPSCPLLHFYTSLDLQLQNSCFFYKHTGWRWSGRSWSCRARNSHEELDFEGLTCSCSPMGIFVWCMRFIESLECVCEVVLRWSREEHRPCAIPLPFVPGLESPTLAYKIQRPKLSHQQ